MLFCIGAQGRLFEKAILEQTLELRCADNGRRTFPGRKANANALRWQQAGGQCR